MKNELDIYIQTKTKILYQVISYHINGDGTYVELIESNDPYKRKFLIKEKEFNNNFKKDIKIIRKLKLKNIFKQKYDLCI